ncbi:hypothetical protein A9G11_02545 [Gilliamella sp. wkB108]|uniref:LarC family nickel insertion protein n=1 Tax=Gilliamella sp. wkB108 TaxID=3120256 RepID=UPI00080EBAFC|nr:LarC family nickel insertion protein [Gilliamella apicola]OCG25000.1 hypothetical protein A9G11_02545 [Gilliamella apicola]
MHIHLDIVGGIAGDMFCSAMLDAFPELETPLRTFLSSLAIFKKYQLEIKATRQKEILGKQFIVLKNHQAIEDTQHLILTPLKDQSHAIIKNRLISDQHEHYSWQEILTKLEQIKANDKIYQCAKAIYTILAKAESEVHGITLENIGLHEVGADDAIIDIIAAAFLITQSNVSSWSCSALPWGQGTIKCAHGTLPVPAPATLKILTNFQWTYDDEIGERITPTGAAILAWIMQHCSGSINGTLIKSGYGCGNRSFKQKPNIVRANVFTTKPQTDLEHDSVYIIQCDIDDMTAENLAISEDKLRSSSGVIDLVSQQIKGKKGRWMNRIEILCQPDKLTDICHQLFTETTTLGVRYWQVKRSKLPREQITINVAQQSWPVKIATRPNHNFTAKLESDCVQLLQTSYAERQNIKYKIELSALNTYTEQLSHHEKPNEKEIKS